MKDDTPPDRTERLAVPVFIISFAGALLFLYLRTFLFPATPFVALGDQTQFFARAVRIVHGQLLYRDFFELVTPGTELLYAQAFRLFGIHAWIMQFWAIALGLALCSVITQIASKLLRGPVVLLPALLFLVFDYSSALDLTHHWYSAFAALAAVTVLMGGASLERIFAAGSFCGLATIFTQTEGTLTFIALIIYLLWLKRSEAESPGILTRLAAFVLPFTLILCWILGYYVYRAGFRTVFFDLVVFPLKFMSSSDANSPRTYLRQLPQVHAPSDIIRFVPFLFVYLLVPYIYFFGLYQLWRGRNVLPTVLRQRLVLLHLVGFALFLAVANGPRYFRLATVAPPAVLICVWLLSQPGPARRRVRNLLGILAAVYALLLIFHRQAQWHATLNLPIGRTAFSDALVYREFQWLAQRTHPSDSFFNDPALSLYLSLRNPTASEFVNDDDYTRPEQVAAVIQSLQRDPPRFIVLVPATRTSANIHDHAAPFRQYVHDHDRLAQVFDLNPNSGYKEELWEPDPRIDRPSGWQRGRRSGGRDNVRFQRRILP